MVLWFGKPRRLPPHDLVTLFLERALAQDGCAICRLLADEAHRSLWSLLWESINDPGIREKLRANLGYCAGHTWLLCQIETSEIGSFLGVAILFADLVREAAHRLDAGQRLVAGRRCDQCRSDREAESTFITGLVRHLEDPAWAARWGPRLRLCLPHGRLALALAPGGVATHLRVGERAVLADLERRLAGATTVDVQRDLAYAQDMLFGYRPDGGSQGLAPLECPLCQAETREEVVLAAQLADDPGMVPCRQHAPLLMPQVGGRALGHRYLAASALVRCIPVPSKSRGCLRQHQPALPEVVVPSCPVCEAMAGRRRALAEAFWRERRDNPVEASRAPLCLPHLELVLAAAPDRHTRVSLRREQAGRLRLLAAELDELIRKLEWNHRDEPIGPEGNSWLRAATCLSGQQWAANPPATERVHHARS